MALDELVRLRARLTEAERVLEEIGEPDVLVEQSGGAWTKQAFERCQSLARAYFAARREWAEKGENDD